ncbi:MAG: hypothetical protein ACI97A_002493 [Planctomycetota bacterium]|jgi:hypothetical protein
MSLWRIIAFSALAFVVGKTCLGQESSPDRIEATFQSEWFQINEKRDLLIAVGNVQLTWGGGSLRCDNAVIWGIKPDEKESKEASNGLFVREIYAEGRVLIRHGENVYTIEAARGFVDPVKNRGVFFNATISTEISGRDGATTVTARAAEAIQLADRRFELQELTLTTSPFSEPGYFISADTLSLQMDPPAQKPGGKPGDTVRNIQYRLDGSVLNVSGIALGPAPTISGNTQDDSFSWLKRVSVDSSNRFGPSVLVSVGTPITIDDQRWGDWTLHTRYLGDRGPGVGLDLKYRTENYAGRLESFYQKDRGQDRLFGNPPSNDRGRVLLRHRHKLPENIQLDVEVSKLSDRGFLHEYYEREFKEDKEQETLIYLKRAVENRAATFLAGTRINNFLDQVEHQPQVGYNIISEPLFDIGDTTIYVDTDYEVSRVRRRFDDDTGFNDIDSFRADLDNKVVVPFFAGPIKIQPFAGFRYTYYSNSRIGERSLHRIGTVYGVQATSQLSRTFDVNGGFFNLNGLRHIVTPEIEYTVVSHVSRQVIDVPQFDRVDAYSESHRIRIGVRNRLQTIWETNKEKRVVDFVDIDVEWTYFPDADRDNFGEHAGNLDVDFVLRLSPRLTYLLDFEYSFVLDTVEVLNTTLGWAPTDEFQVGLGYRRYVDVNDVVLIQAQWRPTERLAFRGLVGYNFEDDEFQDARLTIVRFGADWVFEIDLSWDNEGDVGFGIAFSPRALFDPRLRARSLRHQPRLYEFGGNLIR